MAKSKKEVVSKEVVLKGHFVTEEGDIIPFCKVLRWKEDTQCFECMDRKYCTPENMPEAVEDFILWADRN